MPTETYQELDIQTSFDEAKKVEDAIVSEAIKHEYDEEDLFALRLSLEEALTNAIQHGNAYDLDKKVALRYLVNRERIDVYVADEGSGFNPNLVPDPTKEENLTCPSGRGIMLMRAYMNLVEFNEKGNEIRIVKLHKSKSGI